MFRGLSAIRSHSQELFALFWPPFLSLRLFFLPLPLAAAAPIPLFTLRSSDTEVLTCGCTLRARECTVCREPRSGAQPVPCATCEYDRYSHSAAAGRCACMLGLGPSAARECASKCNYARAQTVFRKERSIMPVPRALLAVLLAVYSQTHLTCKELGQCSKLRIRCPFGDPRDFSPQYLPFLVTSF